MKKSILSLLVFTTLFSCNQQNGNPVKINTSGNDLNDTLKIIKSFKGLYIANGTVKTFIDCDKPTILHGVENKSNQIDSLYKSILPNAYQGEAIYLEMEAEINAPTDNAFSDLLVVKKFIKAEQKSNKNTCIPYDYWCMGNEPFWQLQISEKENLIDFYDPMEQKTIHFIYSRSEIKNGNTFYSASDEKSKNTITVSIKNEKCSDGMSEKQYNYKAEVVLNGRSLNGCAVKFGEIIK